MADGVNSLGTKVRAGKASYAKQALPAVLGVAQYWVLLQQKHPVVLLCDLSVTQPAYLKSISGQP